MNGAQTYQVFRVTGTDSPTLVATTSASSLTDVGGASGLAYTYTIVPVLSSGPDQTQTQTASATWAAATSSPVVLNVGPATTSWSGTVVLVVSARTGDGAGSVSWSLVSSTGVTTQAGTATAKPQSTDPLTWTAQASWDSSTVADGAYTLNISVVDGSGHTTTQTSQVHVINAAPAAPTSVGASPVGEQVIITWQQPSAANGALYLVQKDTNLEPVAAVAAGSLSWTDDQATPGQHTYAVTLEDQFGHVSTSATASANVGNGAAPTKKPSLKLTLPSGQALASDGAVDDRLILSTNLKASSGVSVQYAIDGGAWTDVQGTWSCAPQCSVEWVVTGLPKGHYTVRALTAGTIGDAVGFTLRGDQGLPAPLAPVAMITPFGVSLSWSASQGELADRYAVQRRSSGGTWTLLDRVNGTTYLDRSAQPGSIDYRVQAYDADGTAGAASAATTIVMPTVVRPDAGGANANPLGAPSSVQAVSGTTSVTVTWTGVTGASAYIVERAWQEAGPYTQVGTTAGTIFRDSAPIAGIAFYRVRATGGGATSDPSTVASGTLVPLRPAGGPASPFVIGSSSNAAATAPPGTITLGSSQSSGSAGASVMVKASGSGSPLSSVQVQALQSGTWYAIGELSVFTGGQTWIASGTIVTSGLADGSHQVRAIGLSTSGQEVSLTAPSTLNVVHTASVVTGVTSVISGDQVVVSWSAAASATSYNVYRAVGTAASRWPRAG